MLDAASFFGKFKGRGMLQSAVWTPTSGGTGTSFEARLMKAGGIGIALMGGEDLAVQFVTADAPGIVQGDLIAMGGKSYKLRDRDRANCSADGTLMSYLIREVTA